MHQLTLMAGNVVFTAYRVPPLFQSGVLHKRELMRAALKVLSAHVGRRRADPKSINLLRGAVPKRVGGLPRRTTVGRRPELES